MNRETRRKQGPELRLESLEGRALLSSGRIDLPEARAAAIERITLRTEARQERLAELRAAREAKQEARALKIQGLRASVVTSTLAPRPESPTTAGPAASRGLQASQDRGEGSSDGFIEDEDADFGGDETNYRLKLRTDGYKFKQDYELKIDDDHDDDQLDDPFVDNSFGALDAFDLFIERFSARAQALVGGGVGGSQDDLADGVVIERERFRNRGGRTFYELDIRAGGNTFKQDYEIKINRDRGTPRGGTFGGLDAFDLFVQRFSARAFDVIDGGTDDQD